MRHRNMYTVYVNIGIGFSTLLIALCSSAIVPCVISRTSLRLISNQMLGAFSHRLCLDKCYVKIEAASVVPNM